MRFFISDLHFAALKQDKTRAISVFEAFCRALPQDGELCILGDFFDFWIEYRYFVPADFVEIYAILLELKSRGVKVKFVRGNHDFMRGDFLKILGVEIFDRIYEFEQNGKKILCTHGYEISGNVLQYLLSAVLRSAVCQFLYKLLPGDFAIWLMKSLSEQSRKKDDGKTDASLRKAKYRECAFNFAVGNDCDILIAGHSHIGDLFEREGKIYANCGIWAKRPTYIAVAGKKIFLKEFCGNDLRNDVVLEEKEVLL